MIQQIGITNFRAVRSLTLTPSGNGIMLLGRNGSGKSTVIEAVRLALFGRCAWTDKAGKGAQQCVSDGETRCEVSVLMQSPAGPLTFSVEINKGKKQRSILTGDGEILTDEEAWKLCGLDRETAEVCATPLDHADFGAVLSDYCVSSITVDDFGFSLGAHDVWLRNFLRYKRLDPKTLDDWREVGDKAYEKRTGDNAGMKLLTQQIEDLGEPILPHGVKPGDLTRITVELDAMLTRRDELIGENAVAAASRPDAEILSDVVELVKQAEMHEAEAGRFGSIAANYHETHKSLVDVLATLAGEYNALNAEVAMLDGFRASIKEHADACPLCGGSTKGKDLAKLLAADIKAIKARISENAKKQADAKDKLDAANEKRRDAECDESANRTAADSYRSKAGLLRESLKKRVRPVSAIQADIDAVNTKALSLQAAREALDRFGRAESLKSQKADLGEEIEHLDWTVTAFRKGELLNKFAANDRLTSLVTAINSELFAYGYACSITAAGRDFDVRLGRLDGVLHPVSICSDGERAMWSLCTSQALSSHKFGLLIQDRIEALDGANKSILRQSIAGVDGVQFLLAGAWTLTNEPTQEQLAGIASAFAPVEVVWMKNGRHAAVKTTKE